MSTSSDVNGSEMSSGLPPLASALSPPAFSLYLKSIFLMLRRQSLFNIMYFLSHYAIALFPLTSRTEKKHRRLVFIHPCLTCEDRLQPVSHPHDVPVAVFNSFPPDVTGTTRKPDKTSCLRDRENLYYNGGSNDRLHSP